MAERRRRRPREGPEPPWLMLRLQFPDTSLAAAATHLESHSIMKHQPIPRPRFSRQPRRPPGKDPRPHPYQPAPARSMRQSGLTFASGMGPGGRIPASDNQASAEFQTVNAHPHGATVRYGPRLCQLSRNHVKPDGTTSRSPPPRLTMRQRAAVNWQTAFGAGYQFTAARLCPLPCRSAIARYQPRPP